MLKTYPGVIQGPPSLSVVSLAAVRGWVVVLAPVAPISVVFPL